MFEDKQYYNSIDLINKYNVSVKNTFNNIDRLEITIKKLYNETDISDKEEEILNTKHVCLMFFIFNELPTIHASHLKEESGIKLVISKQEIISDTLENIFFNNSFEESDLIINNKSKNFSIIIKYKFSNDLVKLPFILEKLLNFQNPIINVEIFFKKDNNIKEIKNLLPFWLI